jgi:hypothetical protein
MGVGGVVNQKTFSLQAWIEWLQYRGASVAPRLIGR